MDVMTFLVPMLKGSPAVKRTVEGLTGQPVDHVMDCLGRFLDDVRKGPGIVDGEAERRTLYNKMYECGVTMGFQPWESEIAAAGLAGYSPVEIAVTFNRRGWKTCAEEVSRMGAEIAPRFRETGIRYGLFKPENAAEAAGAEAGIPDNNVSDGGSEPPWRRAADHRPGTDVPGQPGREN